MDKHAKDDFDTGRTFVRVREIRPDGLVEFDFAIGEPELFVEMILPATAFDEFCATQHVAFLSGATDPDDLDGQQQYRLSDSARRNY